MLILTRKPNETIEIHGPARVVVMKTKSGRVTLGVEADPQTLVLRGELKREVMK